jgi:Predicted dithiol-disulfide isomerase involved in polyketide biosynthesis
MSEPVRIAMYSDVHCPYAYLTAYRLHLLRKEYHDSVIIQYKSLSLEYKNRRGTPKEILDSETPILLLQEPTIPYQPWHAPSTEWPVTMWPAFEAIKCAERQGWEQAADLDWAIRSAFFHGSKCISLRSVLIGLAEHIKALDVDRFVRDFDSGVCKQLVLQESQEGWERLKVLNSPTLVLPDGRQLSYFALPKVSLDPRQHYRVTQIEPAQLLPDQTPLDAFRVLFQELRTLHN